MARASLGSLVVSLGLEAAEFTAGLTKSEYDARKFAKNLERGVADAAKAAGIAIGLMGAAAGAALIAIDQLAKQAGNFKDLEEKTGGSAEGLASMAVAAGTAGASMDTVAAASVKLTKSLTGVDDESKAAGAALTALGIPIKEFKNLDPAVQMETVAKALAGFEDGAAKTAVALALFGKAGADLLPFMKELAGESGRQVILTKQMIEQADAYADAQARAKAQVNLYAQALATAALPAILDVTKAGAEFIKTLLGIDSAGKNLAAGQSTIAAFANGVADAFAFVVDAGDGVVRIFEAIGKGHAAQAAIAGAVWRGQIGEAKAIAEAAAEDIKAILARPLFSAKLAQQRATREADDARRAIEDRGFTPPGRQLNFGGAVTGGKSATARAQKEATDEAKRYLEQLERQLEKTEELTNVEKVLNDILKERVTFRKGGVTPDQLLAAAAELDAMKALKKADEEAIQREKNIQEATNQSIKSAMQEVEQMKHSNEQMQEQIVFLKGGEEAVNRLTDAKLQATIVEKEAVLATLKHLEADERWIAQVEEHIRLLKERQGLIGDMRLAAKMREEAQALQDVKNMFSDALVDPLTDFVTGTKSAKDAFKDFVSDISRQLARIASQNVANALFGGTNQSGPDFFGVLAKMMGSFFGGGAGGAGGGLNLSSYGPAFAMGGVSRGGLALVGERGPELVHLPAGARVTPNSQSREQIGGGTVVVNQYIDRNADTRAHRQAALAAFNGAAGAARRR